jgi:hypothetical protein
MLAHGRPSCPDTAFLGLPNVQVQQHLCVSFVSGNFPTLHSHRCRSSPTTLHPIAGCATPHLQRADEAGQLWSSSGGAGEAVPMGVSLGNKQV